MGKSREQFLQLRESRKEQRKYQKPRLAKKYITMQPTESIMYFVNDENEQLGLFLLNTLEGRTILSMSDTSEKLEYLVKKYHEQQGIPNWKFADNYDEGIDWVCFGDLFNNLNTKLKVEKLQQSS